MAVAALMMAERCEQGKDEARRVARSRDAFRAICMWVLGTRVTLSLYGFYFRCLEC